MFTLEEDDFILLVHVNVRNKNSLEHRSLQIVTQILISDFKKKEYVLEKTQKKTTF